MATIKNLHLARLAVEAKTIPLCSAHKVEVATQARFFEQALANLAADAVVRNNHLLARSRGAAIQALLDMLHSVVGVKLLRKAICYIILW